MDAARAFMPGLREPLEDEATEEPVPIKALCDCVRELNCSWLKRKRCKSSSFKRKRCISSSVAFRDNASIATPAFASMGWQFKHLPFRTLPCTVMGIILKSLFWKRFSPQVTHSPRLRRCSCRWAGVITDPVELKSVPSWSMVASPNPSVPKCLGWQPKWPTLTVQKNQGTGRCARLSLCFFVYNVNTLDVKYKRIKNGDVIKIQRTRPLVTHGGTKNCHQQRLIAPLPLV